MTSQISSLSTILSEPDVARLIGEPGPWWIWSSDASKLILANLSGARAMGATGVAIAMERDYATTHAFAGQVARLAPLLPADGTPRTERMRVAGRFGSESVAAEAWRLRAGDVGLIALRLPSMRRGSPREAVIAFVTDFKLPALAFDAAGTPLAASGGAAALASTPLRDLLGPDTDTSLAAITATGRATIQLVNGPMTLVAVPGADATVAVLAASSEATTVQGLRLVASVADARAEETAAPAAASQADAEPPAAADAPGQEALAEEALAATDAPTPEAPDAPTIAVPVGEPGAPEPTAIKAPEVDPVATVLEPEPEAGTLAAAPIATPVQVEAETATGPAPSEAAQKEPQEIAAPANHVDDLAVPQRFSWRLDADLRFHAIAPESVAAPADATFDDAVRRFGLDPQGALAEAVAARRPFSGVPAIWPLGSGGRRLAVTLAAFPTLRDGGFQGYAGFGLIVEELAAVEPATTAAALAVVTPAEKNPEAEAAPDAIEEPVVAAPVDAPEAAVNEASDGEAPGESTPTESVENRDTDALPATDDPVPAEIEPVQDEPAVDASETVSYTDTDDRPDQTADAALDDSAAAPQSLPDQPAEKSPAEPESPRAPPAETRPILTVHTNPPNVVALRTSIGQDLKRPQLSPGERNAFREIARALGARTDEEQATTDPAATRVPEPLPPPVEQVRAEVDVVPTAPTDETTPTPIDQPAAQALPDGAVADTAEAPATPAEDVPVARFVESGTPFGPLPSAFGADAVPQQDPSGDLASLLDRVPAGLVVHRGNAILFANRTLLDWIGFADAADLERAGGISRLFAGGPDDTGSDAVTLTTEDGSAVPVEVNLSRIAWAGDSAFLFSLRRVEPVLETVADHESATLSELRGRLDEVEQILDTATDGIVIVTADGAIESMNRSAEALFGYESAEVKGRSITALFAPESHRSALDYCDGLLSNGVASVLNDGRQIIGRVKQGGLIPLYMTMGRTGPASKPKLAAVFRDMTQWKKAEEDLIAAKRQAEQASSQKSDFLAKISHEIRTPLNAIIGFSEVMMEERFGPVGNERYRDYLKDIHASGGHVLSLINDLLDLSKIEAGKLELAFTSVDLNEMVQSTVATMQPQANRDRVIIRSSLQPRLPNVVADARSLRQIVLNLLSNSVKFTPAGGQIIVSTGLSDAGEAVLRVRDTGIGMTESELRAAMEPFRQVATSNPRAAKGTGLGLPLTKALVEANRASFGISSTPNQGTLVEVVFPPTRVLAE
ncbi:histidine kinase dimerization/phospho-acceptor domain-containing protein [Phreatobacter sp. HK31-P]